MQLRRKKERCSEDECRPADRRRCLASTGIAATLRPQARTSRIALWLLISLTAALQAAVGDCVPAPSGLVSWWPGDGYAADIAGTNSGVLQGGASASAPGVDGSAFGFDGTNAFVLIPDSPSLRPANLTIECWVQFDSLNSAGSGNSPPGDQYIVFKQNSRSNAFEGFALSKTRSGSSDFFTFIVSSSSGQSVSARSSTTISTGVWYHVAGVRTFDAVQLYVNGALQDQSRARFPLDYGNYPLYFGTSGQPSRDHKFSGSLDEISLYNRALSSTEIAAIYAAGSAGKCKAPNITAQPQSQSVLRGSNATFSVSATGFRVLSYQWCFNGAYIAGATTTALFLPNVQATNAGTYSVVVSNTVGSALSAPAVLTVLLPPAITLQPASQQARQNSDIQISAAVTGTLPLYYQWQKGAIPLANGGRISGANSSALAISAVQVTDAGTYSLRVTNAYGSVTSSNAVLTVMLLPPCALAPADLVGWWPAENDGSDAAGGNTAVLINGVGYTNGMVGSAFDFNGIDGRVIVSNAPALDVSTNDFAIEAWIRPLYNVTDYGVMTIVCQRVAPDITHSLGYEFALVYGQLALRLSTSLPGDGQAWSTSGPDLRDGNWHHAAVTVARNSTNGGQFFVDGQVVLTFDPTGQNGSLSTTEPLRIGNHETANFNGFFKGQIDEVSLYSRALNAGEVQAIFNAGISGKCPLPPSVLGQPGDQTVPAGQSAAFSVRAGGTPPLSYQWLFNGTPLADGSTVSGSSSATLSLPRTRAANVGGYSVIVTNALGAATSSIAQLTLTAPVSSVVAWGYNGDGQTNVPAGLTDVVAVAAGDYHSVVLRRNGTVLAWGRNWDGECNVPPGLSNVVAITAGNYFSAAVQADGTIVEWGYLPILGQPPAALTHPVALQGSGALLLSLQPDATPLAWGYPYYGQLDIPPAATNVLAIAAGRAQHNLALRADQTIVGWGDDTYGESDVPAGLTNVAAIAVGWGYSVALKADSTVAAWGWNDYGQVNVPAGLSNVVAIASGYEHTVGIVQDGSVRAWGRDRIGQTEVPAGLSNVVAVSGGTFHTLALSRVGPPEIVQQPWNEAVVRDGTVELAVGVVGDHLQYAWQFNGTPLPGATLANLLLTQVQPAQAGTYSVVVSNDLGVVQSSNAVVTVVPLAITAQPTNQATYEATDVSFNVGVAGSGPWAYQWRLNGSALPGQTNQMLLLPNVDAAQAGTYSVLVSNAYGSLQSTDAVLTVYLPSMIGQPSDQTVVGGQQVSFAVAATGAALTYQWLLNGLGLAGQTNSVLTLSNVAPDQAGAYSALVSDSHRTLQSSNALLTVIPFLFTLQPSNTAVIVTSNATLSAAVSGTAPLFYQWQKDGQNLADGPAVSGSQSNMLTITGAQTADAGSYQLIITNAWGAVTSQVAVLEVQVPPSFVLSPTNQTWITGTSVSLFSLATGSATLSYQWYQGTTPLTPNARLSGTASPTLSISNVLASDAGSYSVVVTNTAGSATSAVAVVTVITPPSFTTQPTGLSVPVGFPAGLSGHLSGTAPLSYQWLMSGTNVPGATSITLSFAALSLSNYGSYQLVATNLGGAVTSAVALLTRGQVAFWGSYSQAGNVPSWPAPGLSNVVSLAAGAGFSLALRGDGTVYGWGFSSSPANVPTNLSDVVGIAAGYGHALAIRSNGTVFAWGSNNSGQTNVPVWLSNVVAVAGGFYHSAALRADGTVVVWGGGVRTGEGNIPLGLIKVAAIDANGNQTLALRENGTVASWGGTTPTPMPPYLHGATAVSAAGTGGDSCLAVLTNGTLAAWYLNGPATNVPPGLTDIVAVDNSVGSGGVEPNGAGTCLALRSNGMVRAWTTGAGAAIGLTNLPAALSNVVALAGGLTHAVALENDGGPVIIRPPVGGTFYSGADLVLKAKAVGAPPLSFQWFNNGNPLPAGTNQTLVLPAAQATDVGSYQLVVSNALGVAQSLAVPVTIMDSAPVFMSQPVSGLALCGSPFSVGASVVGSGPMQLTWLQNGSPIASGTNQLYADRAQPQHGGAYQLIASNPFGAVTSAVAQITFSRVGSWGGGPNPTNAPFDLGSVLAVASGSYHGLVIQSNRTVAAWGTTLNGATNVPPGLSNVVALGGGNYFSVALKSDGTVTAWGLGSSGQTNVPAGLSNVIAISVGPAYTLALRRDGTVTGWGYNSSGQLYFPPGLSNVVSIAAGSSGCLALKSDGTVTGWGSFGKPPSSTNAVAISAGYNYAIILQANGTIVPLSLSVSGPTLPLGLTNIVAISAGGGWQGFTHSVAMRADGTLVAWGNNSNGQLMIPPDLLSATTISAGGGSTLAYLNARSPAFTVQPWNRTVPSGTNVTLRALTVGQPLVRYQWYSNGQPLAGATSNYLAFPSTQPAQSGAYQLVAMNDFGAVTSAVATLTVTVPPVRLASLGLAANGFRFSFISLPSVLYIVEFKDTLPAATWTELERRFGLGGLEVVTDPSALGPARYYRVRALYAPPPRVASTSWNGSAVNFSFATVSGAVYVIQYKEHLNDAAWQELSRQTGTGAPIVVTDPSPVALSRFYRIQVE